MTTIYNLLTLTLRPPGYFFFIILCLLVPWKKIFTTQKPRWSLTVRKSRYMVLSLKIEIKSIDSGDRLPEFES